VTNFTAKTLASSQSWRMDIEDLPTDSWDGGVSRLDAIRPRADLPAAAALVWFATDGTPAISVRRAGYPSRPNDM
jgi:hypothetical protein